MQHHVLIPLVLATSIECRSLTRLELEDGRHFDLTMARALDPIAAAKSPCGLEAQCIDLLLAGAQQWASAALDTDEPSGDHSLALHVEASILAHDMVRTPVQCTPAYVCMHVHARACVCGCVHVWCVSSCHAVLCPCLCRRVVLGWAVSCHAMPCRAACRAVPCRAMSCRIMSGRVVTGHGT